ncbi:ATP-dependent RecD-like DNA helicase [Bacillus alveayuensis]|jgi:exodeoxyribonuclease V alpha subunit|uniref:SF1B family DNA helicase RecD2 n=1 Tax=Aeribacillus alveayuensis TaxID=279215 RepID=UPI0005D12885|nr:ATP-dependent RecD-like DNA helicase [Bacillus alveayuensis]
MTEEQLNMFQAEKPYLKGIIRHIVFQNEENFFTVLNVKVEETNEDFSEKQITVTGYFPLLNVNETYIFFGQKKNHPKFGLQFQAEAYQKELPTTKEGVIQYLSSDLFKGIGKKTAESIVEELGERAISLILENPKVLNRVKKLTKEKAKSLVEALKAHQGLEQTMIALNQFGFGPQLGMKIYQTYKDLTLNIIQKNPYQLVEDVEGIGFIRADELGRQLGISGNHPDRIKAACLYTIEQDCLQDGHVYLTKDQLLTKTSHLLMRAGSDSVEKDEIERELVSLQEEGKIIEEENRIYIPTLYFAEKGLAKNIKRILEQDDFENYFPESDFLLALGRIEEKMNVQYGSTQKDAIQTAIHSPMMLLTGGPGTGKTTVIKGIVEIYAHLHGISLNPNDYKKDEPFPILLVAPTGRAAKRMNEATGLPAFTIHRLLGWNGGEGFDYDEENPINGKLLIVDEVSMVDIWLANQLFKALPTSIQVILVGDEDQLPSVGPGQVLSDLLKANVIPTVRLTDIYRQSEGSSIIELAHNIRKGKLSKDILSPTRDRSFISCSGEQVKEVVQKVVENARKKGYSQKDIQVLAPMYRGAAGIDQLNEMLQHTLNPPSEHKREIQYGNVTYRVGDKVLQLVNQPESNVFNGDMGEIVSIFFASENTEKEDLIVISFDGIEVTYTKQDFGQFTHAYCCSIHKSQGSEFPIVILPIVKSYYRMLKRNLIYTAVTRSKQFLIMCGEIEALKRGIELKEELKRQTTLVERLTINTELEELQKQLPFSVNDANIGMENITPYDFMEEEAE